jgi:predicted porin
MQKKSRDFPAAVRKFSMRKEPMLAVLGLCAGVAHAQSSVTLYGSVNDGLRNVVNGTKAGGAVLSSNGTYNADRWGLLGREDLGGGYYATFNLEEGFAASTGTEISSNVLFQRASTVGLGGAFGQVDFGHQWTMQHHVIKDFEPFDFYYVGVTEAAAISGGTLGHDDNATYYHGDFGNWTIRAGYAPGGVPGSLASGTMLATGASYRSDTFRIGTGYTHRSNPSSSTPTQYFGNDQYTAGGAVVIGPVDMMAGYSVDLQNVATGVHGLTRNQYLWGGLKYHVSPFVNIAAAYYDDDNSTNGVSGRKDVAIINVTYSLSKQTQLYADVDYTRYTGVYMTSATLNPSGHSKVPGVSLGINKWF